MLQEQRPTFAIQLQEQMVASRAFLKLCLAFVAVATTMCAPSTAHAGMPAVQFHELVRLRLEVISFFCLGFLTCSAVVFWIWNYLRKDFAKLPRLSFARACGVVALWGLLFVVVLTMISGARELMTPGAWERDGATYKLKNAKDEITAPASQDRVNRISRLENLYAVLASYAAAHDDVFPSLEEVEVVAKDLMNLPDASGVRLIYIPNRKYSGESALLAYEPTVYEGEPLALFTDGHVQTLEFNQILELRQGGSRQ